ncbi:hypothetical protein GPA26_09150 [Aromatoleum petrolei]|uniref:Uncharacterized protein n=1 Tax=Aromatoleum petrolei TaxID=76116 RepID=A0ABX1MU57_9RHOO|nr:hypothetical protein [Aromatoleum petrolei]QTQ34637.1 Uncharacterized protein ToN1_04650 [Aromatoleum petrolei]
MELLTDVGKFQDEDDGGGNACRVYLEYRADYDPQFSSSESRATHARQAP